ncbi:NT-type C2 domain [Dillenia turbinata]|uniref:NT-type C2 domain n=1 Tax=Dillenia turbinata TaxID=194707 RepID=A0AAN8UKZ8_9MAGN
MMLRCSPWPPAPEMRKYLVKVKGMKLEGLAYEEKMEEQSKAAKVMKVELKWKGAIKYTIVPFQSRPKNVTTQRLIMAESIVWDEHFENVCNFVVNDDLSFGPWNLSFSLLYGESKSKLKVVGKISINIAELASRTTESEIEQKLPLILQVNGGTREVTLSVLLGFIEMRTSPEPPRIAPHSVELDKEKASEEVSSRDSNESAIFDSAGKLEAESLSVNVRPGPMVDKSRSCSGSDTRLDQVQKAGFSCKRRRLSFVVDRAKDDPILKKTNQDKHKEIGVDSTQTGSSNPVSTGSLQEAPLSSSLSGCQDDNFKEDSWETKEIISRDGQAKLKANVFFASFDQRSEKAAGESACTALVALVAHWLLANPEAMLTKAVFDNLIAEGSYEWRKLCDDEANISSFPDKHLDLDTVLQAEVRPLIVLHEKSFIGFFSPDKFENLKGFMSFDDIWKEIASKNEDNEPRVYIVSWNDHFFVLKAEADAYYIIDSLGERLYEGCNQAYALKFDETTLMYGKVAKEEVASDEMAVEESASASPKESESTSPKEEYEEIICSGKECCREYIKRFLAAILLKELEEEEKKGAVSNMILHHRLQIDFHYTSTCSGSSPSCVSSSSSSLFSDE